VIACMEPLLAALQEPEAQLLRWADMEGRSMQSIADALGISLTATKSRVQRARKQLAAVTRHCCAVTMDARGRVTALTPRRARPSDPCQCAREHAVGAGIIWAASAQVATRHVDSRLPSPAATQQAEAARCDLDGLASS